MVLYDERRLQILGNQDVESLTDSVFQLVRICKAPDKDDYECATGIKLLLKVAWAKGYKECATHNYEESEERARR